MWQPSIQVYGYRGHRLWAAVALFCAGLASCNAIEPSANPIDYDQVILLDAESLAEAGIQEAYGQLRVELTEYVGTPMDIEEIVSDEESLYTVYAGEKEYEISGPGLQESEGQSWGRATYALFKIVNSQLESTDIRFYAVNGGNDLGGVFLTEQQAVEAREHLERESDWPYMPTMEHPYYGQAY